MERAGATCSAIHRGRRLRVVAHAAPSCPTSAHSASGEGDVLHVVLVGLLRLVLHTLSPFKLVTCDAHPTIFLPLSLGVVRGTHYSSRQDGHLRLLALRISEITNSSPLLWHTVLRAATKW